MFTVSVVDNRNNQMLNSVRDTVLKRAFNVDIPKMYLQFTCVARDMDIPTVDVDDIFQTAVMKSIERFEPSKPLTGMIRVALSEETRRYQIHTGRQRTATREAALLSAFFSRNPDTIAKHEFHVADFVSRLPETLQRACHVLLSGKSMDYAAKQVGIADMRTLRKRLREAFKLYIDDQKPTK